MEEKNGLVSYHVLLPKCQTYRANHMSALQVEEIIRRHSKAIFSTYVMSRPVPSRHVTSHHVKSRHGTFD
eukprot:13987552-Ditylum_brightwellii.AAC.1